MTVKYYADASGYHADVIYDGEALHPPTREGRTYQPDPPQGPPYEPYSSPYPPNNRIGRKIQPPKDKPSDKEWEDKYATDKPKPAPKTKWTPPLPPPTKSPPILPKKNSYDAALKAVEVSQETSDGPDSVEKSYTKGHQTRVKNYNGENENANTSEHNYKKYEDLKKKSNIATTSKPVWHKKPKVSDEGEDMQWEVQTHRKGKNLITSSLHQSQNPKIKPFVDKEWEEKQKEKAITTPEPVVDEEWEQKASYNRPVFPRYDNEWDGMYRRPTHRPAPRLPEWQRERKPPRNGRKYQKISRLGFDDEWQRTAAEGYRHGRRVNRGYNYEKDLYELHDPAVAFSSRKLDYRSLEGNIIKTNVQKDAEYGKPFNKQPRERKTYNTVYFRQHTTSTAKPNRKIEESETSLENFEDGLANEITWMRGLGRFGDKNRDRGRTRKEKNIPELLQSVKVSERKFTQKKDQFSIGAPLLRTTTASVAKSPTISNTPFYHLPEPTEEQPSTESFEYNSYNGSVRKASINIGDVLNDEKDVPEVMAKKAKTVIKEPSKSTTTSKPKLLFLPAASTTPTSEIKTPILPETPHMELSTESSENIFKKVLDSEENYTTENSTNTKETEFKFSNGVSSTSSSIRTESTISSKMETKGHQKNNDFKNKNEKFSKTFFAPTFRKKVRKVKVTRVSSSRSRSSHPLVRKRKRKQGRSKKSGRRHSRQEAAAPEPISLG